MRDEVKLLYTIMLSNDSINHNVIRRDGGDYTVTYTELYYPGYKGVPFKIERGYLIAFIPANVLCVEEL